jgi:hypothetical protein
VAADIQMKKKNHKFAQGHERNIHTIEQFHDICSSEKIFEITANKKA